MTFERVHFAQDVMVEHSDTIRFANSVFLGPGTSLTAAHSVDTRVTQSSFTGFATAAISLPGSTGAHLAGNLYDNHAGPALQVFAPDGVRYSDYNSYACHPGRMATGRGRRHAGGGAGRSRPGRPGDRSGIRGGGQLGRLDQSRRRSSAAASRGTRSAPRGATYRARNCAFSTGRLCTA